MKISANRLEQQLVNTVLPLYWIAGDEPMLMQETCDVIRQFAKSNNFNHKLIFDLDTKFNWDNFIFETKSLSLFSDKTFIELRAGEKKLPEQGRKVLANYLQNPMADKLILLISGKVDTATQNTKWFQAIEEKSGFVAVWPLTGMELLQWIDKSFKHYQLTVSKEAKQFLIERGEGNLLAIKQDIEKLSLLYQESPIEFEQVRSVISDNARYDVFALADAVLEGKADRVIKILKSLREEGTEAILALWALTREIRLLSELQESAEPLSPALQRKHAIWPKRVPLFQKALQRKIVYAGFLMQCAEIDGMIKGVKLGNVWDSLERLSLQVAGCKL